MPHGDHLTDLLLPYRDLALTLATAFDRGLTAPDLTATLKKHAAEDGAPLACVMDTVLVAHGLLTGLGPAAADLESEWAPGALVAAAVWANQSLTATT